MFADPTTPNLADFYAVAIGQGVPAADLPSGALSTVTIDTSGNISALATSGTVQAGMILSNPLGSYLSSWNTTSGTVSPAPTEAVSEPSITVYSPYVGWALNYAIQVALPGPGIGAGLSGFAGQYILAVYNLALHQLLKIGQDQPNQSFFTQIQAQYKIGKLIPGVVMASGDQATSETLVVPEFFKNLTLSELDLVKTPYGREYLGYAQMYGPSIVGFS